MFSRLAIIEELLKPMIEAKVVYVVDVAIEQHLENEEVKEWADWFMKRICSKK